MQLGEGLTKTFNIPISHLDFDYVDKCSNSNELEKIYVTLKSGEEGKYPELESFCENKLRTLCPESRVLRKPTELKTMDQLDQEQRNQLIQDFQSWLTEMHNAEETVTKLHPTERGDGVPIKNYPIRGKQTVTVTENKAKQSSTKTTTKSCKPKDYNEWSKIADQLEKQLIVEEAEEQQSTVTVKKEKEPETKKCTQVPDLTSKVDTTGWSQAEKERMAMLEKDKGNEAFRAGDFEEADIYYCRSLSIQTNISVFNNRGLIYMKQKKWEEAIHDFNIVIKREPSNVKALMRRATCYSEIHNLQDSIIDCQKILKLSPNNKSAETLLSKVQEELQKRAQPKLKDGRRMVITEVGSDEENSDDNLSDTIVQDVDMNKNQSDKSSKAHEASKDEQSEILIPEDTSEQAFITLKDEGNELFKELKYEEALAIYDVLTTRWPSNPIGYRNKAACNLMLERYEEVIKDCNTAIELDATSHLSFYRRGKAYKILKCYDESLKDLKEALRISPSHRQIKDEANEVTSLLHEINMASLSTNCPIDDKVECLVSSEHHSSVGTDNSDTVTEDSTIDLQRSSPMSGTWEFLDKGDLQCCSSERHDEQDTSIIIVEDNVMDSRPATVATIEQTTTIQMSKIEFDKKIISIKTRYEWKAMIQLLVDAKPANLAALFGEKLDGFIFERMISSLVIYSSNPVHATFIKSVLEELVKVKRFCFVKMMVSDYVVCELGQLFDYLKINCDNQAQLDSLKLNYL